MRENAFTFVEVLITLSVIGIVAVLTIPALINAIQDSQYKTAYKKAFSVLSQAVLQANKDNLLVDAHSTSPRPTDFDNNFLAIMSEFNVVKKCINNNNSSCWDSTGELFGLNFSSGHPLPKAYAFIDSSGMAWSQYWEAQSHMFVDTNGFKKPNQWGKDRFVIYVASDTAPDTGLPTKVVPTPDDYINTCTNNVCGTQNNYYATSWLYN